MTSGDDTIKMLVRLPADLRAELERLAQGDGKYPPSSINGALVFLLRAGIKAQQQQDPR
jgi:hypothetical protein